MEPMWNKKRKKRTNQASQGYIGPTVSEVFFSLKDEPQGSKKCCFIKNYCISHKYFYKFRGARKLVG